MDDRRCIHAETADFTTSRIMTLACEYALDIVSFSVFVLIYMFIMYCGLHAYFSFRMYICEASLQTPPPQNGTQNEMVVILDYNLIGFIKLQ